MVDGEASIALHHVNVDVPCYIVQDSLFFAGAEAGDGNHVVMSG